jgi:hypothetical protein
VVAFGAVLFFVVLAIMVGCLFWFGFGQFFLIEEKNEIKKTALRHLLNLIQIQQTAKSHTYIYSFVCKHNPLTAKKNPVQPQVRQKLILVILMYVNS